MMYKREGAFISVEQIDGFGKNPGLWVGTDHPNQQVKVASFGNKEKADLFVQFMDYLTGYRDDVKWE